MITKDLRGIWDLYLDADKKYEKPPVCHDTITLPDSTAHAKKGIPTNVPRMDCMTDRYYFEGYAWYSRTIEVEKDWSDKIIILFLERTRISTVYIDGEEISTENSLCGFHKHDLTDKLSYGVHTLTVRVNNTDYPTKGGHMTSPDTQTNWNGIVGRIELQIKEKIYPDNIQVYTETPEKVTVTSEIFGIKDGVAQVNISRKAGEVLYQNSYPVINGIFCAEFSLSGNNLLWDEYHTNLLVAEVSIDNESISTVFGIRKLSNDKRRLLINGNEVFWRGKHDGLVFPNTGYAPMTVNEWKNVFATVKEYGINHYRFHTCCPPEAAFAAADEMGIYMEPELPFWGSILLPEEEGFNSEEQNYLIEEGYRIMRDFGNHPSFVMLSMGNELWGSKERINSFLHEYKKTDRRHFYTQGSNNFQFVPEVLEEEDVFCGVRFAKERLFRGSYAMCDAPQGHIQIKAPDSSHNYDSIITPLKMSDEERNTEGYIEIQYGTGTKSVKAESINKALVPQIPVISHEIGQFCVFPDFTELDRYDGSQQPLYLNIYKDRMVKNNTFKQWKAFFRAAGTFAVDCYRREIETALRSKELSGFQLLDLQDFPGQCIALVGVLNSWLENKGLVSPSEWRRFCNDTVILGEINSFVVKEGQKLKIPVKLSVCNRKSFKGSALSCRIIVDTEVVKENTLPITYLKDTRLQEVGIVSYSVPRLEKACKIRIVLQIVGTEYSNEYTLWAYPDYPVKISETEILYENKRLLIAHSLEESKAFQSKGEPFIYIPEPEEDSVEGTYCTDFWNYPMFRSISENMNRKVPVGTLGLYIHKENEFFKNFPCENYSTPQWFHLVMHSHCNVLDGKEECRPIVQPIDNIERCHKLGMLYFQDDILVCTSRLWEINHYPEVKAFAKALSEYILS